MTKFFKLKAAAERFAASQRRKGLYASVFETPVHPHASTARQRAQRYYEVKYDTGSALMGIGNPPSGWQRAKAVKIEQKGGKVVVRVRR